MPELRINGLVDESIVDGPGLRYVVFTQGCPHHCKGCHNPETHAPEGGYSISAGEILERFTENPLLSGITFSGGEPFLQPAPLVWLGQRIKATGKTIIIYTGYTLEALLQQATENEAVKELLLLADTLVDGPYIEALRDATLSFRGSANQRVLTRDEIHKAMLSGDCTA